jgi:hypothetical protein
MPPACRERKRGGQDQPAQLHDRRSGGVRHETAQSCAGIEKKSGNWIDQAACLRKIDVMVKLDA